MPTFRVWHRQPTNDDNVFWVYAVDDWDARNQIAATFHFDAHDEDIFGCEEDNSVLVRLNYVVHKDGTLTLCPTPEAGDDERPLH